MHSQIDLDIIATISSRHLCAALATHAAARPNDGKIDVFDHSEAALTSEYAYTVWRAGLIALLRGLGGLVLDAVSSVCGAEPHGILWSALDATPHIADEEAYESAAADHARRGGDLYHRCALMGYETTSEHRGMASEDVWRWGGCLLGVLGAVCDEIHTERPAWLVATLKSMDL